MSEDPKKAALSAVREEGRRAGIADDLRAEGWCVAVHNDYRMNGESYTFWLFTKGERCVKGEGRTDAEALAAVRALARSSRAGAERGTAEVETLVARLDAIRRLDPIDAQDADAIHRAREEGRRAGIEEAAKRLTLWRKAGVRVLSDGPQREALLDLASDAIAAVRALARGGSR